MAIATGMLLGGVTFGFTACKNGCGDESEGGVTSTLGFALETVVLEQGDLYVPEVLAAEGALTYTSDNENVISITDGKLAAKSVGQATVTVSDGKNSDTLIVTVNADNVPVLSFVNATSAVYVGGDYRLPVELSYKGVAVTEEIEYEFTLLGEGATEIAAISESGELTGLKEGSVTVEVTANYRYFSLSDTCEVAVLDYSNIALNQGQVQLCTKALNEGEKESVPLYAIVTEHGERVENAEITWEITGENVVSFSDGELTAVGAGEATIKASYQTSSGKEVYAECFVSVAKPLRESGARTVYYRNKQQFILPEINNLATGNGLLADGDITQIYSRDGVHSGATPLQIVDSTLNDALWNGAETVWTVCTQRVDYLVTVEVHTASIATAQELMDVHKFVYEDIPNNQVLGDIRLEENIDMTGQDWLPAYNIGKSEKFEGGEQKFNGVFDGCGYAITGFSVGNGEALISQLGVNGAVKNLNVQGGYVDYNGRTGLIARLIYGGRFENIEITAKHGQGGKAATEAPGILFGQLFSYETRTYGTTYLENVKITATDEVMATHAFASALGCTGNTGAAWDNTAAEGEENNSLIVLNNVEINGFKNLFAYNGAAITTQTEMKSRFNCNALTVTEKTYQQIIAEKTTQLPAREVELDANADYTVTVDFTTMVSGEIAKISIDGAAINGTSRVFGKSDTSNVAKTCLIETTNGDLYAVSITVWSMLIDSEEELMNANLYGTVTDGAYYGYFKLTKDLDMASYTWAKANQIDNGSAKNSKEKGFQGVFDGNGKTIDNFKITAGNGGLFFATGKSAVIKNLTLSNATHASVNSSTGILVYDVSGGTFENVAITVTAAPKSGNVTEGMGVLFGMVYNYSDKVTLKNVSIANLDATTEYGTEANHLGTALGRLAANDKNLLIMDGVSITGFGDYVLAVTNFIVGADCKLTLASNSNGVSPTSTEGGILNYVTLGEGGLTINGESVVA